MAGAEHGSGLNQDIADAKIHAGGTHETPGRNTFQNLDGIAIGCCVFLHLDGIGTFGQRRTGIDANGLPGLQGPREAATGLGLANLLQGHRGVQGIGGFKRVTIHGGYRQRRMRQPGSQIAGDDTAQTIDQGNVLYIHEGYVFGDKLQGFINGDHLGISSLPSSRTGKCGTQEISQGCPSGSAKYPTYPPQGISTGFFRMVAPASLTTAIK